MSILDLQVKVFSDDIVEYKFYKKVVITPYLILSRSALPTKIKWASLVQEGVRSGGCSTHCGSWTGTPSSPTSSQSSPEP